ncbi:amidohydrolase [Nonomuraea typhae]|uniref:amidohydrolase n=1 Tax=Nonomuraea typhae TaxID=2603600 RepID=UPI0012FBAF16|nr:amidohydrolase family protein [Nonomuraea typhae]
MTLALVNGRILTLDPARPHATSVLVADGTIAALDAAPPRGAEVVDLRGRLVLPGVNDSHLHACAYGLNRPPYCLDVARDSIAAITAQVREAVRRAVPGAWIRGIGWNPGSLAEARMPTREDLDAVAPDNPVLLQDFSGHATWVNTRVMDAAGAKGDGVFHHGDQGLVQRLIPAPEGGLPGVLRETVTGLNRLGITSFTEPGLGPGGAESFGGGMGPGVLAAYADLAGDGTLTARVSVLGLPSPMSGASVADTLAWLAAPPGLGDVDPRVLRLTGVKVFADGIPPSETAWMREPYPGGGHGALCVRGGSDGERVAELAEILRLVHVAGWQAGVHVVGSRGIDAVTEALAAIARDHPRPDARHYVIHGQYASGQALATLGGLGYGINLQPVLQRLESGTTRALFGDEAAEREWPARSALAAGVHTACSSDAPVTSPDWRPGVAALLARAGEGVTLEEALRSYTTAGAWQDFAETWKGTITPGKVADLFVSAATAPEELTDAPVELTVFAGRMVHAS